MMELKLISSNDTEGFTFRGRFTDQKDDSGSKLVLSAMLKVRKHITPLRWLIRRQGYHKVEDEFVRCFVAWAVKLKTNPRPMRQLLGFPR